MIRKTILLPFVVLLAMTGCRWSDNPSNEARLAVISQGLKKRFHTVSARSGARGGLAPLELIHDDTEIAEFLRRFYEARNYEPAWTDGRELTEHATALISDYAKSEEEGIRVDPAEAEALVRLLERTKDDPEAEAWVETDLLLSKTFMRLMRALVGGQADPESLTSENYLNPPPISLDSLLTQVLSDPAPSSFTASLAPQHSHYTRLKDALARYREIRDAGGWPTVVLGEGEQLEPGESDDRVSTLRRRLAATGDLIEAGTGTTYDAALVAAVVRFQERHGLRVDSVVGGSTLDALNVPVEDRIREIERNLERWRWLPRTLGTRYILVNIPEFMVHAYEPTGEVLTMRVVVGARYGHRQTPTFADEMDHVVFRPYWNVPVGIAVGELLPRTRDDASYLNRNGYEVVGASGEVVSGVRLDADELKAGEYRVRQRTGPNNALGLVKFMFPNVHHVYLHDTPADHLFGRSERAFSHGCIRLEDPARFAEYVLGPEGWTRARIDRALSADVQEVVQLEHTIPVYIVYMTAFVADDGRVAFRKDLYGYDAALEKALPDVKRSPSDALLMVASTAAAMP